MEPVEPVERIGREEVGYLAFSEIVNCGVPIGMKPASWIGIFVQGDAIETCKTMHIGREMRWHPIKDHTNPSLMRPVDQTAQAGGITEAPRRGKQSYRLITPGCIERVLGNR